MSEQPIRQDIQTTISRITQKLKTLHRPLGNHEQKQGDESEAIAREAILLFANQEHQEPIATFYVGAESVLEIDKQNPGTIFRVTQQAPEGYLNTGEIYYCFFVLGGGEKNQRNVYVVIPSENDDELDNGKSEKLILFSSWRLKKLPSSNLEDLEMNNLNDIARFLDTSSEKAKSLISIDKMTAGKTVREPERETQRLKQLVPVTETARS
jgi:hypothetical protein